MCTGINIWVRCRISPTRRDCSWNRLLWKSLSLIPTQVWKSDGKYIINVLFDWRSNLPTTAAHGREGSEKGSFSINFFKAEEITFRTGGSIECVVANSALVLHCRICRALPFDYCWSLESELCANTSGASSTHMFKTLEGNFTLVLISSFPWGWGWVCGCGCDGRFSPCG